MVWAVVFVVLKQTKKTYFVLILSGVIREQGAADITGTVLAVGVKELDEDLVIFERLESHNFRSGGEGSHVRGMCVCRGVMTAGMKGVGGEIAVRFRNIT